MMVLLIDVMNYIFLGDFPVLVVMAQQRIKNFIDPQNLRRSPLYFDLIATGSDFAVRECRCDFFDVLIFYPKKVD